MTVHYTGVARVNRTQDQIASYIKATERYHMNRDPNMSAIGYNFAVDKWGRVWELRGWGFRNAANGTSSNSASFSVVCLVGVEDVPTSEMVEALRSLYADGCRRFGRSLAVRGHQEHKATSCPGGALMALIRSRSIQSGATIPAPPAIPEPQPAPAATATYTVVRNDSYWRIATKLLGSGTRWREIADLNGGRGLHPGITIRVPASGVTYPENTPATPPPSPTQPDTSYTVQRGDSYWRIAKKLLGNGARWTEIADLNGGRGRVIHPGDELRIPGGAP